MHVRDGELTKTITGVIRRSASAPATMVDRGILPGSRVRELLSSEAK